MTEVKELNGLIEALSQQEQIDEDGVLCGVSRQAVDEAIEHLRKLADRDEREAALRAKVYSLRGTLVEARGHIDQDRESFAEANTYPDGRLDNEDAETLADMDALLQRIDDALAEAR